MYAQKGGATVVGGRLHFLGIVSSVCFRREEGSIELRPIPVVDAAVSVTREMIDLGLVIKAQPVLETAHQMIERYSRPTASPYLRSETIFYGRRTLRLRCVRRSQAPSDGHIMAGVRSLARFVHSARVEGRNTQP
jgi:hypothetical protein